MKHDPGQAPKKGDPMPDRSGKPKGGEADGALDDRDLEKVSGGMSAADTQLPAHSRSTTDGGTLLPDAPA